MPDWTDFKFRAAHFYLEVFVMVLDLFLDVNYGLVVFNLDVPLLPGSSENIAS